MSLRHFSSLGLTVLEELGNKQTNILTYYCFRSFSVELVEINDKEDKI